MFEKKDPNPYSEYFGEYIADFVSTNKEVSAILFKTAAGTRVYVKFAPGKGFKNLKDSFFSSIFQYLQEKHYPKPCSIHFN